MCDRVVLASFFLSRKNKKVTPFFFFFILFLYLLLWSLVVTKLQPLVEACIERFGRRNGVCFDQLLHLNRPFFNSFCNLALVLFLMGEW